MPSEMTPSDRIKAVFAARRENRPDVAQAQAAAAVAQARSQDSFELLAKALCAYGQVRRDAGALQESLLAYREAAELLSERGLPLDHAHAHRHLGEIYMEAGDLENAKSAIAMASELYAAHENEVDPLILANLSRSNAILCEQLGQASGARQHWSRARAIYEEVSIVEGVRECDAHLSLPPSSRDS